MSDIRGGDQNDEQKIFDYIAFISAKDRRFNYHVGTIEKLNGGVDSFDSAIRYLNKILFNNESSDTVPIVDFEGKIFIIFDDYETFPQEDKEKIVNFIKSLNIEHHKVVITTRSANHITGEEIEVQELSPKESLEFFDNALENELGITNFDYKKGFEIEDLQNAIHKITNGRPLFIFQSAIIYGKNGSINSVLNSNVNNTTNAIDFLYGRILDYLSPSAKLIFGAMSLLINNNDLSNLLTKLQYILNMEKKDNDFLSAIQELVKLKIITVIDNTYFIVYSADIIPIMANSFSDPSGDILNRLKIVGSDRKLDNNLSLLVDADNSRISRKPSEVKQKYRHLISRDATPDDIKIKAIVNLAQYIIEDMGNLDEGLSIFNEFKSKYLRNKDFLNAFSFYLWKGSSDHKKMAADVIKDILVIPEITEKMRLEYLCTLMHYEATLLIQDREDLKYSLSADEISKKEYERRFAEQRDLFFRIYRYPGEEILKVINDDSLKSFEHDLKIKLLNGLSHLIEVCIRRQMFSEIDMILNYVFNNLKYNYHEILKRKLPMINSLRKDKCIKKYDDYIVPGSVGDRLYRTAESQKQRIGTFGKLLMESFGNSDK